MPREELPKNPPKPQKKRKRWFEEKERQEKARKQREKERHEAELAAITGPKPAAPGGAANQIKDHGELETLLKKAGYAKH